MESKPIRWITFIILVLGAGTVFKISNLKDAFYVPMQTFMGLNNTQIGVALSVYGIVQAIGNFASIYIADRFSKKLLIPFALCGVGSVGFYISTFPDYYGILIGWGLLAIFADVLYWPVLLKAVRLLGDSSMQGRLFGFLEAGRGVVDTIIAFTALGIFVLLGKGAEGLQSAIIFYSICSIIAGILAYFFLEHDEVKVVEGQSHNKIAFDGMLKALKMPEIWVVSLTIFTIYAVYCGVTYFIPFLNDIYGMPVALVSAYGIVNQYVLKFVGGPIGGYLVDKKFHSAAAYLRTALILAAICIIGFIFLPHNSLNIYLGMCLTLGFAAIIFTMRAVFFAPVDEIQVPTEITGAAMAITCLLGYSPQLFCFALYGYLIDTYEGLLGYQIVFALMGFFAICGIIVTQYLLKVIQKKKALA